MAVGSQQYALTTTASIVAQAPTGPTNVGPVGAVMVLPDASVDVYLGGINVSTSNGLKITHGTTLPLGPIYLFPGDTLYAVCGTTATLAVLQT